MRYARIVLEGRAPFIIRVTNESERTISGIEVDREGEEIVPVGYHNRLHVIERAAIRKMTELRMNHHYGMLEAE